MRTQQAIEELLDKAATETENPTRKRSGMSYEEGVRIALEWVLDPEIPDEEGPFE